MFTFYAVTTQSLINLRTLASTHWSGSLFLCLSACLSIRKARTTVRIFVKSDVVEFYYNLWIQSSFHFDRKKIMNTYVTRIRACAFVRIST
jgi:hypothetical protein